MSLKDEEPSDNDISKKKENNKQYSYMMNRELTDSSEKIQVV
jgi:hypothetical protein